MSNDKSAHCMAHAKWINPWHSKAMYMQFHHVPSPQHPLNIFKYPFLLNIIQYILISSRKILVPRCESICTPVIPSAQCLRLPAASPPQIGEKTQQKRFGAWWSLSLVTQRSPGGFQLITATWPPVTVLSLEWMRSASAKYNSEIFWNWMQWTQLLHLHVPWMLVSSSWWW